MLRAVAAGDAGTAERAMREIIALARAGGLNYEEAWLAARVEMLSGAVCVSRAGGCVSAANSKWSISGEIK